DVARAGVLGLLLAVAAGCNRAETQTAAPKPPAVEVSYPFVREVTDYEDVTGRTEAIPTVDVRPHVTGYLKQVFFKDGDVVKKGEDLLEIGGRTYEADVEKAKAAVLQASARVRRLEADYERVLPLRRKGTVTPQEFDMVSGDFQEAKASKISAEAALKRAEVD